MKKKQYVQPRMEVVPITTDNLLLGASAAEDKGLKINSSESEEDLWSRPEEAL